MPRSNESIPITLWESSVLAGTSRNHPIDVDRELDSIDTIESSIIEDRMTAQGWYITGLPESSSSVETMGHKAHPVDERVHTPLRNHQEKALAQMAGMERGPIVLRDVTVRTRVGVLADPPGSGKTLSVLAHVASAPLPQTDYMCASTPHSMLGLASVQIHEDPAPMRWTPIDATLVVVPHYLEFQWIQDLKEHTSLRYTTVGRKHMQTNLCELMEGFDVILCKNTVYKPFLDEMQRQVPDGKWARMVVDEADSVRIPSGPMPMADFYWLVTATPDRLFQGTVKSRVVRDIAHQVPWEGLFHLNLQRYVCITNPVDATITRTHPNVQWMRYRCTRPRDVHMLENLISEDAFACLTADDRIGAASLMGHVVDESSLVSTVAHRLRADIEQTQLVLEGMQVQETSPQVETVIRNAEARMRDLLRKWETLEERLRQRGDCPICYGEIRSEDPYVTYACCQNRTCTDCCAQLSKGLRLLEYGVRDAQCPFCRTALNTHSVIVAQNEQGRTQRRTRSSLVSKTECLERMIRTHIANDADFRMIVFSESSGRWDNVADKLDEMRVPYETIKGSATEVERIVRRFRQNHTRVLLLNTMDVGSGLNLQCATDLVLYHEPSSIDLRTQVVGRADRPGRTNGLRVHVLTYEDEG